MSYIRALSNPEGLYITGNTYGQVEIMQALEDRLMPRHVFEGLLKRWFTKEEEHAKYRGATITELSSKYGIDAWKYELNYKNWDSPIRLWRVTLVYICTRNNFRWAKE